MTPNIRSTFNSLSLSMKKIRRNLFIDYGADYRNSVFLAGTGRSGTTWLSDIINYRNEYRYIFEPFYPAKVDICKHFRYKEYFRPSHHDEKHLIPAQLILTGKVRNYWIDSHNRKTISNKRLIKDIRANFLLRWLHEHFPGMKIILVLRHPCAVAHSRTKLKWDLHFEEFLFNQDLIEDFLSPFIDKIWSAESDFEKCIFLWCIENYVPLKQFKKGEIHLTFYENFCATPEDEIRKVFEFLGKQVDEDVFSTLENPSVTSRKDSAIINRTNLVDPWRKNISDEQTLRAVDILAMFGLDGIYNQDSMPDADMAYKFMDKN